MKLSGFLFAAVVAVMMFAPTRGLSEAPDGPPISASSGIVVDQVTPNSEAYRAGLREGDVLIAWQRGSAKGKLSTPFDLSRLESEQGFQGAVVFQGLRNDRPRQWVLGIDFWDLKARPRLDPHLLSLYLEGKKYALQPQITVAESKWREAALLAEKTGPPWLSSWFFFKITDLYFKPGNPDMEDRAFQEALDHTKNTDVLIKSAIFWNWGYAAEFEDRLAAAEQHYQAWLEQQLILGKDSMAVAVSLLYIGRIDLKLGNFSAAANHLNHALSLETRLARKSLMMSLTLDGLGVMAHEQGNLGEADLYYHRALEIEQELTPRNNNVSLTLFNLGELACERGNLQRATHYYVRALDHSEKLDRNSLETATILGGFGECKLSFGDLLSAERYEKRALLIREKLGHGSLDVAFSYKSLGSIAQRRGDLESAENYYRKAVNVGGKLSPSPPELADFLTCLAELLYQQGKISAAADYFLRALEIRGSVSSETEGYARIVAGLARTSRNAGNINDAKKYYEQALVAIEAESGKLGGSEEDRAEFRAKHRRYYAEYVDLLVEKKQPELALEASERSRARILLESLSSSRVELQKGVPAELIERERLLQAGIRNKTERYLRLKFDGDAKEKQLVEEEIIRLTAEAQDVQGQIRSASRDTTLVQPETLPLAQIQQTFLDPDTVLLEYSLDEMRSHVFVVSQKSLNVYQLPGKATVEKAALRLYESLANQKQASSERGGAELGEENKAIAQLSSIALAPLAAEIKDKRLLVVSDGALAYIPFSVLLDPSEAVPSPLVLHHEIINLPSVSVMPWLLKQRGRHAESTKSVAVLADPVFDQKDSRILYAGSPSTLAIAKESTRSFPDPHRAPSLAAMMRNSASGLRSADFALPRLIFSRNEADAIMSVIPSGTGLKAVDFMANKRTATSALLSQYRIVHFATHGLLDSEHPELSGLVLSLVNKNGRPQEGFLGLKDIYDLNLSAELVVLSACQTGLGKEISGEGIVGLVHAFMHSGTPKVMASLWNVSDLATARQMTLFYTAMEREGLSPAAALRFAQIKMLKEKRWNSPYYWAAFQLYGDWH